MATSCSSRSWGRVSYALVTSTYMNGGAVHRLLTYSPRAPVSHLFCPVEQGPYLPLANPGVTRPRQDQGAVPTGLPCCGALAEMHACPPDCDTPGRAWVCLSTPHVF